MKPALRILFGIICLLGIFHIKPAQAACSSPAGVEGEIIYNETHYVPQYCDNTNWVAMIGGDPSSGTAIGNLVGWWRLDETSGTTAADSSGNGNDGTMINALNAGTDSVTGAINTALNFDGAGTDQAVIIPDPFPSSPEEITLSLWIKSPDYDNGDGAFNTFAAQIKDSGDNSTFTFSYNEAANELRFAVRNTSDVSVSTAVNVTATDTWTHFVGTYDGSNVKLYMDGVEVDSLPQTGAIFDSNNAFAIGGKWQYGTYPAGNLYHDGEHDIDDVRIYDRVLSTTEITQLYNMGAPVGSSTALPQGCPNIGDVCDDGTIYVGDYDDGSGGGSQPYYTTPEHGPDIIGNDGNTDFTDVTGATSNTNGLANTLALVTSDSNSVTSGFQPHQAAQYCYDLVAHGSDDWYLAARYEYSAVACSNQSLLPGYTGWNWSSTQSSSTRFQRVRSDTCGYSAQDKNGQHEIRCVRKGPAPRCASPYGVEGDMFYNTTADVVQYCDGARWLAIGKDG